MGWLDWLAKEAKNGNTEALAVLRSRRIGQFKAIMYFAQAKLAMARR
ncbi:MAG: hypothetical protein IPP22_08215 [Nitrosomonas sp.]|nr:hypothetical protein [Nitrosomonas sp.]